jgi:hypothetical protein
METTSSVNRVDVSNVRMPRSPKNNVRITFREDVVRGPEEFVDFRRHAALAKGRASRSDPPRAAAGNFAPSGNRSRAYRRTRRQVPPVPGPCVPVTTGRPVSAETSARSLNLLRPRPWKDHGDVRGLNARPRSSVGARGLRGLRDGHDLLAAFDRTRPGDENRLRAAERHVAHAHRSVRRLEVARREHVRTIAGERGADTRERPQTVGQIAPARRGAPRWPSSG